MDLRTYGWPWFAALKLPDFEFKTYVTRCDVDSWAIRDMRLEIHDTILGTEFYFKNHEVLAHAYRRELTRGEILIDDAWLARYPAILKEK